MVLIKDKSFNVALPFAFDMKTYINKLDYLDANYIPGKLNNDEDDLYIFYFEKNHKIKVYVNYNQTFFQFMYLIDDITIHTYIDTVTSDYEGSREVVRVVDGVIIFQILEFEGNILIQKERY